MPTTNGDGKTYLPSVTHMDNTTPAAGITFDQIHQQLVNNDSALMNAILAILQKGVPSGVIDFVYGVTSGYTSSSIQNGQIQVPSTSNAGAFTGINTFIVGQFMANISGNTSKVYNYGGYNWANYPNIVTLDPPPPANVTPSLPGSARDDLVFLEFWYPITGGTAWRIRVVDGVDFSGFYGVDGLGAGGPSLSRSAIYAQGGQSSPVTSNSRYAFLPCDSNAFSQGHAPVQDSGLYIAGNKDTLTTTSQTDLSSLGGWVYAIPLFRVRRRNNAGFDPDNNPLGARDYYTVTFPVGAIALTVGQSFTATLSSGTTTGMQVGDYLGTPNSSNIYMQVTAINGSTSFTANVLMAVNANQTVTFANTISGRPEGLYSNIIDASDIVDLRHQVSLTGFNYQALLEKNLDLLLRGQLTTNQQVKYGRDYIGLNLSGYNDDANTLLFCKFDGTANGTANGANVTATRKGNGSSEIYKNGVQGQSLYFNQSGSWYYEQYPLPALSASAGTVEMFFTVDSSIPNGYDRVFRIGDDSGVIFEIYRIQNGTGWSIFARGNGISYPGHSALIPNEWHYLSATWTSTQLTGYIDNIQLGSVSITTPITIGTNPYITVGGADSSPNNFEGRIDFLRVSNIVRNTSPLPSNLSFANGDRILDGANSDFFQWSDDLGGIAGVNGRTNPYGLSRVPNQVAARVAYNGSEVRHYFSQGLTPGWTPNSVPGTNPTGSFDYSTENTPITSNESADGTRATFTFNLPSRSDLNVTDNLHLVYFGSTVQTASGASISNGVLTVVLSSPPASGTSVQIYPRYSAKHAHFIPSIKGFVMHDWTDDSVSADGTKTTFQTSKFNVLTISAVRTTPSGSATQTQVMSGTTNQGLNCATTLTANAAVNATTIAVASGSNFFVGQNIRIAKGDGTWYTTTVSGVSGNTITVPALTAALSQNAVVQGTAQVTFTTAPAAGTVDIVYESVITPSLGDYIRVMYQHTPYQGMGQSSDSLTITAMDYSVRVTTRGTGKLPGHYQTTLPNITPQLPLSANMTDASFKGDSVKPATIASTNVVNPINNTNFDNDFALCPIKIRSILVGLGVEGIEGVTFTLSSTTSTAVLRGFNYLSVGGSCFAAQGDDLPSSVPHLNLMALIAKDQNGVLRLVVITHNRTDAVVAISGNPNDQVGIDTFHLQGRPMIKGYGGVAA